LWAYFIFPIASPVGTLRSEVLAAIRFASTEVDPSALVGFAGPSRFPPSCDGFGRRGSRSVAFPAPSLAFTRHRAGLRGIPSSPSTHRAGFVQCDCLLGLSSPSELSPRAGSVTLLSWDSSACASPPTCRSDVHSRKPLPTPFGQVLPGTRSRSASAVSHRLDGLLHPTVAGLFRPATGQRFTAFPAWRDCSRPKTEASHAAFPAMRHHTPRRIPLVSSRTASPRPLPSCRLHTFHASPRSSRSHRSSSTAEAASLLWLVPGGIRPVRASLGDSNRSRPPSVLPCQARTTLIPAPCRDCRSSPAREPGVDRSPPLLATSLRHEGGSRFTRRRECTRWQRPAGLRTASTRSLVVLPKKGEPGTPASRSSRVAGSLVRTGLRRPVPPIGGLASGSMPSG
jgi:hypothetical protein